MFFKSKSNTLPPIVVNLGRDKLTVCDKNSASILTFPYPQGCVLDMEIVNYDILASELKNFILSHKIAPAHLILVMSSAIYFEKNLTSLSELERAEQSQKFLDMIPFGSVSSKLFKLGNDYKIVAMNRDFYESIKSVFESLGFSVSAVVPDFILSSVGIKENFDIEACRLVLRRMDFVMENSFLAPEEAQQTLATPRHFIHKHQGIFAALSLIFVVTAIVTAVYTLRRPTPSRPVSAHTPAVPVNTQSPVAVPTLEEMSAADLTVNILHASKVTRLTLDLEAEIKTLGFEKIATGTASVSSANTLVVYTPRVPQPLRDLLGDVLRKYFSNISVTENPDSAYDIVITAGPPQVKNTPPLDKSF